MINLLKKWEVPHAVNRRGTITTELKGKKSSAIKALYVLLDTLGLIVTGLKDNGRLAIREVGYLTSLMIEGARVTSHRPLKEKFRGKAPLLKTSNHLHDHDPILIQSESHSYVFSYASCQSHKGIYNVMIGLSIAKSKLC